MSLQEASFKYIQYQILSVEIHKIAGTLYGKLFYWYFKLLIVISKGEKTYWNLDFFSIKLEQFKIYKNIYLQYKEYLECANTRVYWLYFRPSLYEDRLNLDNCSVQFTHRRGVQIFTVKNRRRCSLFQFRIAFRERTGGGGTIIQPKIRRWEATARSICTRGFTGVQSEPAKTIDRLEHANAGFMPGLRWKFQPLRQILTLVMYTLQRWQGNTRRPAVFDFDEATTIR